MAIKLTTAQKTEGAIGALSYAYLVVLGLQPQHLAIDF